MNVLFYISSVVAVVATLFTITRSNAVHALLYFIVSLLSSAVIFFTLGAPYIAALEVIIYAGAIMVLFIFVVMMLNVSEEKEKENNLITPKYWIGPSILTLILFVDFMIIISSGGQGQIAGVQITPKAVGISLFSKYILAVQMAGLLLMAGIIGAYHIGKKKSASKHRFLKEGNYHG